MKTSGEVVMDEKPVVTKPLLDLRSIHPVAELIDAVSVRLAGVAGELRDCEVCTAEQAASTVTVVDDAIADLHQAHGSLSSLLQPEREPFVSEWQICGESVLPSDAYV